MNPHHIGAPVEAQNDTIFVVFELSKATWRLGIVIPGSAKLSHHTVAGGDTAAVARLLDAARDKAHRRGAGPVRIVSAYEAGYDGFWLDRWLAARGVTNHVLDPASIQVNRRARRAKTDRLDVDLLMRVLLAYHRGEPRVCSIARPPSVGHEDARRRTRERERLVRERGAHGNRIKGLLFAQGIRDVRPLSPALPDRLAGLRTGDGRALEPALLAEIGREHVRLHLIVEQLRALEADSRALARADLVAGAGHDTATAKVALLVRLRGIGEISARILVNEVFWRRFDNRRQVGSYVGLTDTPFHSGKMRRDQGISKAGNPRARTLAIELAWLWLRHQPDSALSQWFNRRVTADGSRSSRKKNIVALARKLIIALWRFVETGLVPHGAILSAEARG